jgi:hypothetical protein
VSITLPRAGNINFICQWCRQHQRNRIQPVYSPNAWWICNSCLGLRANSTENSATLVDEGGCQPTSTTNHRHGIRTNNDRIGCIGCAGFVITSSTNEYPSTTDVKTALSSIETKLNNKKKTKKRTLLEKAEPYINSGLTEPFALAIVKAMNEDDSLRIQQVLDLWEATWWKPNEPDDVLILGVLKGDLSERDARLVSEFRGMHPELALACINKQITVNWAAMLLDAGFEEHPEAVRDILNGGLPNIVARIRRIKVDYEATPPGLGEKIVPEAAKSEGSEPTKQEMKIHLNSMSDEAWANLFTTHLKGGAPDSTANRSKLETIFENSWLVSPGKLGEVKDVRDWATFFNIKGRSTLTHGSLRKKVQKKAREIQRFVRSEME